MLLLWIVCAKTGDGVAFERLSSRANRPWHGGLAISSRWRGSLAWNFAALAGFGALGAARIQNAAERRGLEMSVPCSLKDADDDRSQEQEHQSNRHDLQITNHGALHARNPTVDAPPCLVNAYQSGTR